MYDERFPKWDKATQAYFDSLPYYLQESILQTGQPIENEADIRGVINGFGRQMEENRKAGSTTL